MNGVELREQDREWRRRLQGLSLVTEADASIDAAMEGLRTVSYHGWNTLEAHDRANYFKRYAPTVLVGLTSIASTQYDEGTFWPRVGEVAELEMTQNRQIQLSDTFRHGLDLLGLSRFHTPLRNLGEILMHAGIPVSSVAGFVRVLEKYDAAHADLTGTAFCSWVTSMSRGAAAAKGLDVPTWRFLSDGGEVAEELVDRFLQVLDAAANSNGAKLPLELLPPHIAAELRRLIATGQLTRAAVGPRKREGRMVPRLLYRGNEAVQIELPPYEHRLGKEVVWQITAAGESIRRSFAPSWPGDAITVHREPVSRPLTSVLVAIEGEDLEWSVPVVDAACPLLVFDAGTGAVIPSSGHLPKGRAWVALPNENDVDFGRALEAEGPVTIIEQVDAPYGWDGWSFAHVDLVDAVKIRPRNDSYRWRYVSSITRPTLEDVPTVPHLRALNDSFVLAARPMLILPATRTRFDAESSSTTWTVTLLDGAGEVVQTGKYEVADEPVTADPWPAGTAPVVGDFQVRAQGPLGRGSTHTVTVAEGMTSATSTPFRWFTPRDGLQPCVLEVCAPGGTTTITLGGEVRRAAITVPGGPGAELTLMTDVDYMWVSEVGPNGAGEPGTGPVQLTSKELVDHELRLNSVPRLSGWVSAIAGTHIAQREVVDANSTGIARLNLGRFADTAALHGVLALRYEAAGQATILAEVRPRELLSNVRLDGHSLHIEPNGESVPLEFGIYLDRAPWREPITVPVPPGARMVELPNAVHRRGPILVIARVSDPWADGRWPTKAYLQHPNTYHFDLPVAACESLEDQFITWVDRPEACPESPEAVQFALQIYPSLRRAKTERNRSLLYADVAALTRARSADVWAAIRRTEWSRSTHTRLLAEGWASADRVAARTIDSQMWARSPYLGLLESLGCWTSKDASLADRLLESLGDSALRILELGEDPSADVGAFRQTVEIMNDWPTERVDEVLRASAPVPGALLDSDQRLLHARELFDARVSPLTRRISAKSGLILRSIHLALQNVLGDKWRAPVRARSGGDGWPSLPCLSISLALLGRLAARGNERAISTFDRYRPQFGDLAEAAPRFVEQDLVLAELWMTHWENE